MTRIATGVSVLALLLVTGCTAVGSFPAQNQTQVQLTHANYKVIKTNVRGSDTGWGLFSSVFGIPIMLDSANDALDDLMDRTDANGRSVALVNVSDNYRVSNWILFYLKTREVRADVIEFAPEPGSPATAGGTTTP